MKTLFCSQIDPNALIGDKLKAMSEAIASGEALPEIDHNDLGWVCFLQLATTTLTNLNAPKQVFVESTTFSGAGKCIVEFEKMGTAVMEDVGTFMIKLVRLGDTSNQVPTH